MPGKARFSPVGAALRWSSDSAAGKNAIVASIASQQVSSARLFDRFTNVICVKVIMICDALMRRKKNRCTIPGTNLPIPTTFFTKAMVRQCAASAVVAVSVAAEVQQDEPPQIESSSHRPHAQLCDSGACTYRCDR